MGQQPINQSFVTPEHCITAHVQTQPDIKAKLLNKVAGIKNWITHHKKEILVGGMALAVVTAVALYYYTSQTAPLHAQSIDAFNAVTPAPPSAPIFFNTTAYQCSSPQDLLIASDACSRIPDHCWRWDSQSKEFFPYYLNGKKYDYSVPGCSKQDLQRLYNSFQTCYNSIINYAREYGLSGLQDQVEKTLKQVKDNWGLLEWYGVVKNHRGISS